MIEKLISKISLNIKGKNINRFIKRLRTKKIEILSLKYKNPNEADIIIYKKDYETVLKIKSIYDVTELDVFGLIKIKRKIKISKHLIVLTLIAFAIFLFFTHVIFDVEVIHSNKDIRNLLLNELKAEGIKKLSFKKSCNEISKIKEKILNKYPDKIEWLEIEENGTKYTVRVEERNIVKENENNTPRNIVAGKDGVLKKVIAEKGDIVKDMNDYDKKIQEMLSDETLHIFDINSTTYIVDEVTGEIQEYPFEEMDPYTEYEYFSTDDKEMFIISANSYGKVNQEEILKGIFIQ